MDSKLFHRAVAGVLPGVCICLSPVACVPQGSGLGADGHDTHTAAVTQWLAAHAVPLASVEAGAGVDDLQPLRTILKDARVVGLGETSHGTREIFQFKHRMVEFLVTQLGFNAVTIEASYPACLKINDYVVYGKGDAAAALAGQGFSHLNTQENLALIEWVRRHNSTLPEAKRVRFLGYDMQHIATLRSGIDAIIEYLQRVAPDHVGEAEAALAPLKRIPSAEERAKILDGVNALHSFLATHRDAFVRQSSAWDFDVVLLHARVIAQNVSLEMALSKNKQPPGLYETIGLRDAYMAENVEAQLKMLGPNARIIVSSHNTHAQAGPWGAGIPSLAGPATREFPEASIPAMGEFLRRAYGAAYYVIGFDFNRGTLQAYGEFTLPEAAPPGSLAWYMSAAGQARGVRNYFVDFRSGPTKGPVAQWLSSWVPITVLPAFVDRRKREEIQGPVLLRQYFDGMVFMEETTPTRLNLKSPESVEYAAGTTKYRLFTSAKASQGTVTKSEDFLINMQQQFTVNIAKQAKDTMVATFTLDFVSRVVVPLTGGGAPGDPDLSPMFGKKFVSYISPTGRVYSTTAADSTNVENDPILAEVQRTVARFLPTYRRDMKQGMVWADTTTEKFTRPNVEGGRTVIDSYKVVGDTVVAGERAFTVERASTVKIVAGSRVVPASGISSQSSTTTSNAVFFLSRTGQYLGGRQNDDHTAKVVFAPSGEIMLGQLAETKIETIK